MIIENGLYTLKIAKVALILWWKALKFTLKEELSKGTYDDLMSQQDLPQRNVKLIISS